ncbi:PTS trehalose transporter subunit IIBC [Clostridium sp. AF19-22AC]|jgi:PTS system trehalose-specific IIC component|uniref:PTS system trehalose-specific IIC component n=1 Tax=Faecalicatena orotica TaxID=1544 RepID=A0A2Y9BFL0_9FIRM|nr:MULTISPECIES: PTS system trehalose-specific EIIBC component [Clostridia]PWJ28289.1 PTS system trehalose-specific IIC component [Faecalicatena orotica]RHR27121.1 PTS trehalose transporter subunit IIBC [Clostridium sp. AF19-22AC]SSA56744.1 PTS system, trehalose-specific IIC component [Faecalicatena orotica]
MGKYAEDAKELLELVGGRQNIAAVSHCMTRMRFVLSDPSIADVKKIEAMKAVKGSFTQSGQFQVIIGNSVADFYNDFVAAAGIEGVSKDAVKQAAKKNQNLLQRAVTAIAEIFAPLIPAIIVGGLILGFRNCIDSLYLFENGTKTLCDISQFWSGIDSFLWLIGEAVFHMLPVGICWSVTKKMGTTQMLGIVLGLTLVSGQLLNAYAVASTAAADIPFWDFGYFKINMIGYQAQVIPAILAAFTLVYLEKFFRKITPQVVSMIVVPFCSLVLAVIAAHFILGPVGWKIGSAISSVVYAGITGSFKVIFGAVFGFVYAPLVITGLHHMTNAIDLQLIADYSGTMLWPMIALSNIAQGSAVLGMITLQRKNAAAQEVNVPACISCYLGVTEPAIFGVNLKHLYPFVCGMIGSACAAVICVATGTTANAIGVGGLPGILSIQPKYMLSFAICMAVAIAVPFLLTVIVGKKKSMKRSETEMIPEDTEEPVKELKAFLDGRVIPLKEVGDGVFSEGVMGDGLAVIPENETLCAPADGTVTVLMEESRHACGLTLSNGMELLLHVGIDTVDMKGDGFEYLVKEGDKVRTGDPLICFDRKKIKQAGHPDTTVCIITDEGEARGIQFHTGIRAEANDTAVITFE